MENHHSAITCCNVNEPQSPAVTSYSGQTQQLHLRQMRDCNMNDTSYIMQLASAPKGHVQASCGLVPQLPQQGFTFRLPMPNAHIPSVGKVEEGKCILRIQSSFACVAWHLLNTKY